MITDCTAIVLAGGDSRRMGQDKAALVLEGKTLLESVTTTMQQVFAMVIVSVRQLRAGVEIPQVCDDPSRTGPLAGLIAGMAEARTPWVFAVACDMPFVTQSVVNQLASYRDEHQAVVPMVGGYPQPLAAFYAMNALEAMRTSLEAGDRSLRGMLRKLDVRYVGEDELRDADPKLRSFIDLDTPSDVAQAQLIRE